MKNGLKIYACSGVGSLGIGAKAEKYDYWLDDTKTISNTIAVNNLLGKINVLATDLRVNEELSDDEVLMELQLIDLYAVCLQAAQIYKESELKRFGSIIARYVEEEKFKYADFDNDNRNEYLNDIYNEIEALFLAGENYIISNAFYDWFISDVVEKNYCGLSQEEQAKVESVIENKISGLGAIDSESKDPASMLHNCGGYFLYNYIPDSTIKKINYGNPIRIK